MSDRTYAETQGKAPFDWCKALENPELYEPDFLNRKAGQWTTCACGNQCAIIPREDSENCTRGRPLDEELYELGHTFHVHIIVQEYEKAKAILHQIEARSAIIIQEELAKLNGSRP